MENLNKKLCSAESLAAFFDEECSMLVEIEALQKQVEDAVYAKKWMDFDNANDKLNAKGAELRMLEENRAAFFGGVKLLSSNDVYIWTSTLEDGMRKRILDSFRALKLQSARVEAAALAFGDYLNAMRDIVSGALDAAFPERRGALYGKHGKPRTPDMRRVVLDKQF